MAIGIITVIVLIVSVCCLYYKKPLWCFVNNIVAIALTYWTGHSWKLLLSNSGKDTTLLGFARYPAALIILTTLLITGLILMVISVIVIIWPNKKE